MKLQIIMHESFETPAAIAVWANLRGYSVSYTKLYAGDPFPQDFDFDFLVIMGGPQSPATTREECPYFDARKEMAFIAQAISQNKTVLGVCLGAQLIGDALGGNFEHSPQREIGVFPITLSEAGKSDPIFSSFPETFRVGHWHGDMPGLTSEAKILAVSDGCPRQIIRYAPRVYAFQCHMEFTKAAIEEMIEYCSDELEQYKNLPYVETAKQLQSHDYFEMNNWLYKFLDSVTARLID